MPIRIRSDMLGSCFGKKKKKKNVSEKSFYFDDLVCVYIDGDYYNFYCLFVCLDFEGYFCIHIYSRMVLTHFSCEILITRVLLCVYIIY